MKLRVNRNELWRGIDTVLEAVSSKPSLPVLANILFEADEKILSLSATDLDLSIRTQVPAIIEEEGRTTVSARKLAEITREWPEAELSIEVQDERLKLSGQLGNAESSEGAYSLSGIDAEEFPNMPTALDGVSLSLGEDEVDKDNNVLIGMINKTVFAVSGDDTRPVFNGVLWRIDAQGMEMVATDGSRLACYRKTIDLQDQIQGDQETAVIVPPQALTQIVKLLGSYKGLVKVTLGETQILFDIGHTHLLSRLIEGPYVNYSQVIPQNNEKELRIASEDLLPALRRASILSSSYTRQVHFKLSSGQMELSAASPEIGGEAREVVPAQYASEEIEVGYNAQYLMEILRRMDAPEVCFELNDHVTAALLRPIDQKEGEDYFCLLMPLRPTG